MVFHALDEKNIRSIARIQLQYFESQLTKLEMKLKRPPTPALDEIDQAGFDPVFGAQSAGARGIQSQMENPLAKEILGEAAFGPKDTIAADSRNGGIKFAKS